MYHPKRGTYGSIRGNLYNSFGRWTKFHVLIVIPCSMVMSCALLLLTDGLQTPSSFEKTATTLIRHYVKIPPEDCCLCTAGYSVPQANVFFESVLAFRTGEFCNTAPRQFRAPRLITFPQGTALYLFTHSRQFVPRSPGICQLGQNNITSWAVVVWTIFIASSWFCAVRTAITAPMFLRVEIQRQRYE